MRLTVAFSDRASCYVALHSTDANVLFSSLGASRHFCRPLRLDRTECRDKEGVPRVYAGWVGDAALARGTLEISPPFAACLGLREGEIVTGSAVADAAVAPSVMVQPHSVDDWEVVELQAGFIEEHLLAQIAVLTPGMVFTAWIHGQMPVKLRVDPKDSNRSECFLLDRNTELVIESRRRVADAVDKPYALFGSGRSKGGGAEPQVRLRVLIEAAADGAAPSHAFDAPFGRVHPEDLEQLAGCAAPESCLAWLRTRSKAQSPPGASGPRLFRVEADARVPRRHLLIGACQAEHARLPCFSLARVWRCRQVPVYVPHMELVPLKPCAVEQDLCHPLPEEDSAWLSRLFRDFVSRCGEIDLMDGAVVQLRDHVVESEAPRAGADECGRSCNGPGKDEPAQASSTSETTDLYEGLSDIDDVYQSSAAFGVTSGAHGILEVDLALDEVSLPPGAWSGSYEPGEQPLPSARRPGTLPVSIRFVLGAAREQLQGAQTAPFVRLTPSSLVSDVKLTVRQSGQIADADLAGGQNLKAGVGASAESPADPLEQLWTAVPHLHLPPEEGWSEVVRLVTPEEGSTLLDGLKLIEEPAACLRQHLLAQLGCPAADNLELDPLGDHLPGFAVPGATAVVGPLGTGKTTLCRRVLAELRRKGVLPLEVACTKLGQPTRKFKAVQEWLGAIFRVACWYSPSAILLDDLGALCPDVEQGAVSLSITEERSVFLAELLLDLLPEVRACGARVALVATLPDQSAIHRVLWCYPAMEHRVPLRSPQLKERPEILQLLCKQQRHSGFDVDESLCREGALDEWGGQVDGFSVADLARLVDRASIEATLDAGAGLLRSEGAFSGSGWNDPQRFSLRHLERACRDFVPATLGDQTFFTSDVRLSDVGGLQGPKQALMDMLMMPTKYAILVDRAPVRPRRGLMLVGPPGCGKTMLVHAAASETRGLLRFLAVKGPELLSKYIGASEAGVRQVFERAAAAAPSVLFFDEIEALAPKRGGDSTGVTDRVVNQMLCYLDGVEDRGRVFVVAATGRPDLVDAALMRPGRFDKICYCGIPSDEERLHICEILAKKHGLVVGAARQHVHSTELRGHLQVLVSQLPRLFTCADLNALFSSAKIEAVNEVLRGEPRDPGGTARRRAPAVALDHLFAALASAKASISETDEHRYTRLFAAYRPGAQQNALRRDGSESQPAGIKVALA